MRTPHETSKYFFFSNSRSILETLLPRIVILQFQQLHRDSLTSLIMCQLYHQTIRLIIGEIFGFYFFREKIGNGPGRQTDRQTDSHSSWPPCIARMSSSHAVGCV